MRKLVLLPLVLALMICGFATEKPLEFTNFKTGETLHGMAYRSHRKIEVTMPDGELLVGKWSSIRNDSVSAGFGSATAAGGGSTATAFGNSMGYSTGGPGSAYAILKSTKPGSILAMEFTASFDSMTGHGYGQARTNDGRDWKVVF
jgi:hypothetical protein